MPGPAPKPTAVLRARGSPLANRNQNEPMPDLTMPDAPDFLDDGGRQEWDRWAHKLNAIGLLTSIDANDFGMYCRLMSIWTECSRFLEKRGMGYAVKDSDGNTTGIEPWPQIKIMNGLTRHILRLSDKFGMNPSARSRISIDPRKRPKTLNAEKGKKSVLRLT